jgi:hypothetical protein
VTVTPEDGHTRLCALCGLRFRPGEGTCRAACPLGAGCSIVCCPRCGYGDVDEHASVLVRAWRRLFRREERGA